MANKGKGKGKTPFWQRRRVTLTQGLASARDFAQSTRSYTAFVNDWSSSDSGPPPMQDSSSSVSSSSGYETPPVGWIGVLYVLQYFQVQMTHFSLHVLRNLRNLLVPTPPAMAAQGNFIAQSLDLDLPYSGQPLSRDEAMPQHAPRPQQTTPVATDLATISRQHAPSRWVYNTATEEWQNHAAKGKGKAYNQRQLEVLRDPPKGRGKRPTKGKQFLNDPDAAPAALSVVLQWAE